MSIAHGVIYIFSLDTIVIVMDVPSHRVFALPTPAVQHIILRFITASLSVR